MAAQVATARPPSFGIETLTAEDFETASIRSAAPSYISEAPSYHSTAPSQSEPVPPYAPPAPRGPTPAARTGASSGSGSGGTSTPRRSPPPSPSVPRGLPPVPSSPVAHPDGVPNLGYFRIPSWSNMAANPTARHYHNVASRRLTRASASSRIEGLKRAVLDRIEEDERNRVRPLEDPYLVGEEAASRARRQRLAVENGTDILIREDRRWDWFLAQNRESDERERAVSQSRRGMGHGSLPRLAHRLGARS